VVGCFREKEFKDGYSSSSAALLDDFYAPSIGKAASYDRAAGYFSSALLALAAPAFIEFAANGGRMRLVCSPNLDSRDAAGLTGKPASDEEVIQALRLVASTDDLSLALTNLMSSMIGAGILSVKFAIPLHGQGIFHDKVGIFLDECGHTVSFVGSANETAAAWSGTGNHEQIEVFRDWLSREQENRTRRHARQFQELWIGAARGLRVMTAQTSAAIIRGVSAPDDLDNSLERVRALLQNRKTGAPPRALRSHQLNVIDAWEKADRKGLIVFATGGGKTLAAIEAIRRWADLGKPSLVLVPSELLHSQWLAELREELPNAQVLRAGAGVDRSDWLRSLSFATSAEHSSEPRVILSTYQTAVTSDFLMRVRAGEHLLLVADEVHRMGAPDCRQLFSIEAGARLGLSATPRRYGDEIGTNAIYSYFGDELEPHFTLADALHAEPPVLVPYDYFVETVTLTEDELDQWVALTKSLAQEIARNDGQMSERALHLARQRARVVKSAEGKVDLARNVIRKQWRDEDRWLIYCDDRQHLAKVRAVVEPLGQPTFEYHSGNSVLGPEVIRQFENGGVLLAIKCLDEGVDLPYINKALILASTTNPREYIQRRGRVLRRREGKHYAVIYDVIAVDGEGIPVMPSELPRAEEFAALASNRAGAVVLDQLRSKASASVDVSGEGDQFEGEDADGE